MGSGQKPDNPRDELYRFVAGRVQRLQAAYLKGTSAGLRQLAELRRAAGQEPGSYAPVWELEFEGMPNSLVGKNARDPAPSAGEWAVHVALTLYAVHQQSQETGMHVQGPNGRLGAAVRTLVWKSPERYTNLAPGEPPRRFAALVSAGSIEEVSHYLRQIVQILRGASVPLDYGQLACDVFDLQNPYRADAVRLAWGRDYARYASGQGADNKFSAQQTNNV